MIDGDVRLATRYLRRREKNRVSFPAELGGIHQAWILRHRTDLLTRATLEARLLAGQSIADTAVACNLPAEVIRLYESLFFSVMDRLRHRAYLIAEAISPRYWSGYTAADADIVVKSLAFLKGPMFLKYILPYFTKP